MDCEEYTTLLAAGLPNSEIPLIVRELMNEHLKVCAYHRGSTFTQSMLGTPVPEEVIKAAREIVRKYSN